MFSRLLGILLFGAIVAVIVLNYQNILLFSQTQELKSSADKAVSAKNWEKALQIYEDGAKRYPDNPDIATRLAWAYRQNKMSDKAEARYRKVLRKSPDFLNAHIGLANLLKDDPARRNEAVDTFRTALRKYPENAILLTQIGNLYQTSADNPQETRETVRKWLYGQAAYYYQNSVKLEPKQFQTQFNLGVAYQNLENLQPSAKAYCQALKLYPDSFQARYNLGMVLTELNFLEEGYRQLDRSIAILSDQGDMKAAMDMAKLVQNVKNSVYYSVNKQGLVPHESPAFLDAGCLYKPGASAENIPD